MLALDAGTYCCDPYAAVQSHHSAGRRELRAADLWVCDTSRIATCRVYACLPVLAPRCSFCLQPLTSCNVRQWLTTRSHAAATHPTLVRQQSAVAIQPEEVNERRRLVVALYPRPQRVH